MSSQLFAIERYDSSGSELTDKTLTLSLPPDGTSRLVGLVHLPADELLLALVEGPDADTVATAVLAAGWRIDRISPATWRSG